MGGVNKVIILGNCGNHPELSYTPGGMAVCKFSLATSRKKNDGAELTSWHRFTAFGKQAEIIAQYVSKGQQLYVEGELSYGQYEKDGITRYTTDIIVNDISFVGSAKQGDKQPQQQNRPQNQQQYPQQQQYNVTTDPGFYEPPKDDDIPF